MNTKKEPSELRLLFLSDGLAPFVMGGMQQHSALLVKYMAPLVQHITLMHCGTTNGPAPSANEVLSEIGNPSNVQVVGIPFVDRGTFPGHYLRALRGLSRAYLNAADGLSDYDAVYAQGLMGDAFLRKHPKVMVNLHGLEMFQEGFSLQERFAKALMRPSFQKQIRNAWRLVSLGGKLTDILIANGVAKDSIAIIPNGIESKWILNEDQLNARIKRRRGDRVRFVMVGRNEFRKGLHVLQAAMKDMSESIELHMIGDWATWDAGIHNVVHHGVIGDKKALMAILDDCDVLLLPSLSEGMPTVILEAAARGLPSIAADVGAVAEIVPRHSTFVPGDEFGLQMAIQNAGTCRIECCKKQFTFTEIARITVLNIGGSLQSLKTLKTP
jgi:glycosyltransferase involved in cell wall biosynthesis